MTQKLTKQQNFLLSEWGEMFETMFFFLYMSPEEIYQDYEIDKKEYDNICKKFGENHIPIPNKLEETRYPEWDIYQQHLKGMNNRAICEKYTISENILKMIIRRISERISDEKEFLEMRDKSDYIPRVFKENNNLEDLEEESAIDEVEEKQPSSKTIYSSSYKKSGYVARPRRR